MSNEMPNKISTICYKWTNEISLDENECKNRKGYSFSIKLRITNINDSSNLSEIKG